MSHGTKSCYQLDSRTSFTVYNILALDLAKCFEADLSVPRTFHGLSVRWLAVTRQIQQNSVLLESVVFVRPTSKSLGLDTERAMTMKCIKLMNSLTKGIRSSTPCDFSLPCNKRPIF